MRRAGPLWLAPFSHSLAVNNARFGPVSSGAVCCVGLRAWHRLKPFSLLVAVSEGIRMYKWKWAACLVLMASMTTAGCRRIVHKIIGDASEKLVSQQMREENAMGLYIDGFNVLVDDAVGCYDGYLRNVPQPGPQADQHYDVRNDDCVRMDQKLSFMQQSFKMAARDASVNMKSLVTHAHAALNSLQVMLRANADADHYYESAAYREDHHAQGLALHQGMLSAIRGFRVDMAEFEADLTAFEEQKTTAELARYSHEKSYSYWFRKSTHDANKLLKVNAEETAAFEQALAQLKRENAPFKAFVTGKGEHLNPSFKVFVDMQDSFDRKATSFLISAQERAEPAQREAVYDQMVGQYNAMVSIGNSLRQLEVNDLLK
jgi:hypothetical protein